MKRLTEIWILLTALLLAGCHRPSPVAKTAYVPSPQLVAIDTLMQSQPDSALTLLMDTTEQDPYYQLLLSEALYKNDYAQANRAELLEAMAYFDSIGEPFLSARCHYMNGVGYYELDSVVPACQEYLKALEIMEEHFEEEELVGYKAKFMALTNTRLCSLFSIQFLHQQVIDCGKNALFFYKKYNADPGHVGWLLNKIGSHYHMMGQLDSADFYYNQVLDLLPDTNNLTYRDNITLKAFLSYHRNNNAQIALKQLYYILSLANNHQEFLSRYSIIGDILFHEKLYDSAWTVLNTVYQESLDERCKRQTAEYLSQMCQFQGKSSEEFDGYLAPFANLYENRTNLVKSKLVECYDTFCQDKKNKHHQNAIKKNQIIALTILIGFVFVILVFVFLFHQKKKKINNLVNQIAEEDFEKKKRNSLEHFLGESICQEIFSSLQGSNIKRSSTPLDYSELILSDRQLQLLSLTVKRYFSSFEIQLEQFGVASNPNLVNLCFLYLLGLNEKQISILLNKDYSTIKRYENKLRDAFKTKKNLVSFLRKIAVNK